MGCDDCNKRILPHVLTDRDITFTCPECGGTDVRLQHLGLRRIKFFLWTDGDVEFGEELPDEFNLAYVCTNCELILENDYGELVNDPVGLTHWVRENCL